MRLWEAILVTFVETLPLLFFVFTLFVLKGVHFMIRTIVLDIYRMKIESGEEPSEMLSFFYSRFSKEKKKEEYDL